MVRGPSTGYIYGIKDPQTDLIVFVGNGRRPWESIWRHLTDSVNPKVSVWARQLRSMHPEGIEVLTNVVCDHYHWEKDGKIGLEPKIPPKPPHLCRLEWVILGEETETYSFDNEDGRQIFTKTKKREVIDRLLKEGHPLLNGQPGRPGQTLYAKPGAINRDEASKRLARLDAERKLLESILADNPPIRQYEEEE